MSNKASSSAVTNNFALNLLDHEIGSHRSQNVVVSPASVAIALGMTLNGGRAETQDGIRAALGQNRGLSLRIINNSFASLLAALRDTGGEAELNIANALWTKDGLKIKPGFLQKNRDHFGALVEALDFAKPASLERMNGWVSENTRHKIPKIIDKIENPDDAVMFLMNAVYFKGDWKTEFDKLLTQGEAFYKTDGSEIEHALMHRNGDFAYLENDDFQAVNLPYGKGGRRFSMYVFLPKLRNASGLREFQRFMRKPAGNFTTLASSFHTNEGELFLPRFKVEYDTTLNDSLAAMGMADAFDDEKADFGGMVKTPPRRKISEVKHKTFIDVTETGTEAAAATSVGIVTVTSVREPVKPFVMRVDRPFYFFIRDNTNDTILFAGVIHDPSK